MSNGKETMKKKPCTDEEWVKFRERLELKKRKNISKAFGTPKINSIPQSVVNNGNPTASTPREDAPKEQTGTGRVQMPKPRYIRLDSDDDESEGNVDRSEAVEEQEKQSGGTTITSKENSSLYSKKVRSISKESKEKIFGRRTSQINCRRPTEVASSMRPKTSFDVRGAMLEDIPPSTIVVPITGEESIEQDFDVCREQPSLENMAAPERNITMQFVDDHLDVNREERENSIAAMIPSHAKTSGEKPSQTPDRHIIRPLKTNQSTPLVEKLFERHLLRFLKELDQGIPDDYIYEGRRIWTDLATRYKIRPDERLKFANEKCRFLKNLEDEDSRPPMWVRDEQETLDLYYSVKKKFKDIIARRGSRQRDSGKDGMEHDDLEVEREETEEPTSIQPRDVSRGGRNGSLDRDRQVEATSAEETGQELDSHSSRPQNSPRLQASPMVKKPLFEKELMRFLKELDQGIPDAYISEGRRVWTDLASRYDIRQNRIKFADSKCRFLANLEDEYSRPPLWMAEDQGTLDLYYSVKQKFKDILARRQSDSDNDDETGPDEVVETEKSTPMQPREDNLDSQDGRNGSVDRDQGEKSLFEKELLRFLKELDQGIPEDYIYKGRRVWTDVATRYGIQPDKKQLFATEKCLFLKNLEDEESRPPVWLRDEQKALDLYYSVKEKFKDIIARRDGDSGDEAELHGHGVEGEKTEEMTSVQSRDVSQDRRNDSVDRDRQVEDTSGEKTGQESDRLSARPRKSLKLQCEKSLFEKELMRFLKELDGGIPDEYMYEGRRVWIDVAVRYGIRDENKRKFSEKKYLFLENLEDQHSRPPRWMPNGQETLDMYYSVKQKFKDIIARKKSLNGDVDMGNETGSEDFEIEEEEEPESEDDDEYRVRQRPWNPTKRISLPPRNRAQTNFYGHSPEKNESTSEKDAVETSSSKKLKRKADIFNIDDVDSGDESLSRDKQAPSSIKRHKIVVPRTTVPVSGFFMRHREQSSSAMSSRNKTSCNSSYTASSTVSRTDVDEANDDLADATQLYEGGNIDQDQKPDWINVENGVEIGVNTDPSPLEDIEEARKEDRREIKDLKKQLAIAWKMVYEEKSQRERIAKLYRKGDDERLQKEFPEMSRD